MKNDIQTYTGLSQMMTRTFDQLSDPVAIVSPDSRYLYMNMASVKLCRLKSPAEATGKYYPEVKVPLFENEQAVAQWQQQDRRIAANPLNELMMLEVHRGATDSPFILKKISLYNEDNQFVGIVHHMKYLDIFRPNDFIMGKLPGSLLLNRPDDFFTEKECEIIFLKLQRMTSKAIAEILNRSPGTIDNMVQELYSKAGVNNITDFAEFCEKRDLHLYLPHRFIDPQRFSFDNGCGSIEL